MAPPLPGFERLRLPDVLTSREAANALRMGIKELRQLVDRGELPAARLGPRRVIRIAKEVPSFRCRARRNRPSLLRLPSPLHCGRCYASVVGTGACSAEMERTPIMERVRGRVEQGAEAAGDTCVQVRSPDGTSKHGLQGTPALNTEGSSRRQPREKHIIRLEDAMRHPKEPNRRRKHRGSRHSRRPFLEICAPQNKPSSLEAKESILRVHLTPAFGRKPLDRIGFADIQDYVASKTKEGLAKKTVNNHLTVMRRLLVVAQKRRADSSSARDRVAEGAEAGFRLPHLRRGSATHRGADDPEWRPMILVAIKAGLRQGELLTLRLGRCRSREGPDRRATVGHEACGDRAEEREGEGRRIG